MAMTVRSVGVLPAPCGPAAALSASVLRAYQQSIAGTATASAGMTSVAFPVASALGVGGAAALNVNLANSGVLTGSGSVSARSLLAVSLPSPASATINRVTIVSSAPSPDQHRGAADRDREATMKKLITPTVST